ncbi:MAG: beta-hydroxyacyl-ACP dehydratase [Planctomycetes bacterium]|nr:beta-hydroxyacyl-ACP dehydratase [Planctomycetota bacterium]
MDPLDRLIDLLPQKPPFLFLDEILEHEPLRRAVGAKTFKEGHAVFENHLPGEPVVPGVILIEALGQLAGIVLVPLDGSITVRGYLAAVNDLRFRRLVRPGERILLSADLDRRFGSAARFAVLASVGGEEAAAGWLTIGGMTRA